MVFVISFFLAARVIFNVVGEVSVGLGWETPPWMNDRQDDMRSFSARGFQSPLPKPLGGAISQGVCL